MEENQAKYSILIYTPEIDDLFADRISDYLKGGIKVYLFSTDSFENYDRNALWIKFREYGLLYWEELLYHKNLPDNEVIIVDGAISGQALYEYICNNSNFNYEQYVIEHERYDIHLIVSAGAGTGKTTVMINRLLYLKHTDQSLSFADIVMITFTNEAAVQMRQKLTEKLINYYKATGQKRYLDWIEDTQKMQISTIHSFAKKLLETVGKELGFPSNLTLRSFRFDKKRIVEKMIDKYALNYPEKFQRFVFIPQFLIVNRILYVNSVLENRSIDSEKIANELDFGDDAENFAQFLHYVLCNLHEELKQIKSEESRWEISDLLLALENMQVVINLRGKISIRYLMVDEFQDTDIFQVRFILWLFEQLHYSLFIVGDEKQSIYRFRGADYTAFRQLQEGLHERSAYPRVYHLIKNYRTTANLLNTMNQLFEQWGSSVVKFKFTETDRLIPVIQGDAGAGLEYFTTQSKLKEIIKGLVHKNLHNEKTAILVRSNQDVQHMVDQCEDMGFFCDGAVKGDFYRTAAVREFYIMIRMLVNQNMLRDYFALHRSSYGANTLSNYRVLDEFDNEKRFLHELLQSQADWKQWQDYRNSAASYPILRVIKDIIEEINPAKVYAERFLTKMAKLHPDQEFAVQAKEAGTRKTEYELNLDYLLYLLLKSFSDTVITLHGIEKYLRLRMQTDNEEMPLSASDSERSHRIRCLTVHKAKGLEFEHVILPINGHLFLRRNRSLVLLNGDSGQWKIGYQLNIQSDVYRNSYFEVISSAENSEIVAEETRLLYVAMTRAKKSLYVHVKDKFARSHGINSWADLLYGRDY